MRCVFIWTVTVATLCLTSANAQNVDHTWVPLIVTSADLAGDATTELRDTTGLSWPDGRQAIVTFWYSGPAMYRCIDYFDSNMQATGGLCYGPDEIRLGP